MLNINALNITSAAPSDTSALDITQRQEPETGLPTVDFNFIVKRVSIPFAIVSLSTLFPAINIVLSLFAGIICGVALFVLPVLFYKAAYVYRPSRKERTFWIVIGNALLIICIPIFMFGVIYNVEEILHQ